MAKSHTSAHDEAAKFSPKLRTVALIVVSLAFVMDLLDSTIVNVAIPTIQHNLGASYSAIQWIVAGYSLAFALLLVTGGRMGDVFGYKKLFLGGVAGFTLASLFSGLAPNVTLLIVARLFQGSMAALMVPQVMSLMQIMYKPEERGAINGLFGGLGGVSASLGPIIGGLLIKANIFNWDWRPIFLINVPVGIFAFFMALRYLPEGKSPHPLKLDIIGTLIIMLTLFFLAFPLIQGRQYGWPTWSIIMLIASIPALAVFIYWQRRKERIDGSPLVLLSLFKKRTFSAGLFLNMFFEAAMAGFFLTLALMLQIGLGFSPIHAALTGLPIAIAIAFTMAVLGERLIPKLGRKSLWIGSSLMALGILYSAYMFHHSTVHTNSWQLIPGLLSFGVGMGFSFGSMFAAVLNDIDSSHAGSASGTLNAVQQVGGAIGIALIGVVFFGQLGSAAAASYNEVAPKLQTELVALHIPSHEAQTISAGVKTCFVARSKEKDSSVVPASCKILNNNNSTKQISNIINNSAGKANAVNFANAFKWSALFDVIILALTFVANFLIPKHLKAMSPV